MIKRKDGFNGERAIILPSAVIQMLEASAISAPLYITDIGYYPHAENHFRKREKAISRFVFIYCATGSGWFELNGIRQEVNENQYFILPADKPHQYGSSETKPWTIYWIHFGGSLAYDYYKGIHFPVDIHPDNSSRMDYRTELFEEIFHTLELGYSIENLEYVSSALHHYLGSLRYLQSYRNAEKRSDKDMITMAIHFMKENIEKQITLTEIAEHVGYSVSHFSALFNKRTHYSPTNYMNQLKMQRACQLLDFTDMKIYQIAYKIGFSDCYYFSRLFHKTIGLSPSAYKKQKKG